MIQVMVCEGSNWLHRNGNTRPYLHVYAHSDEKDETGVIGLSGVNVEFNPGMEELLGVSDEQVTIICDYVLITSIVTETIRIYVVHSIELVRTCSTKPQGASFMGNEIGPDSNIIMIYIYYRSVFHAIHLSKYTRSLALIWSAWKEVKGVFYIAIVVCCPITDPRHSNVIYISRPFGKFLNTFSSTYPKTYYVYNLLCRVLLDSWILPPFV